MAAQPKTPLEVIEGQLRELDAILKQATQDLNTVAGRERVAKWKAKTVPLLAQHVGQQEAQEFAGKHPGPSFTNDLIEELTDEAEFYRTLLVGLAKKHQPSAGSAAEPS
jgi:hypothetical protein